MSTHCVCVLSHVQLFMIAWTIVCQAPLSMEFYREEYWSGLPFTTPGVPSAGMVNTILKYFKILLHHLWLPLFCWKVGCDSYYSSFKYSLPAIPSGFFNDFLFIFDFQQLLYGVHMCGFPIIYTACGLPCFLNLWFDVYWFGKFSTFISSIIASWPFSLYS